MEAPLPAPSDAAPAAAGPPASAGGTQAALQQQPQAPPPPDRLVAVALTPTFDSAYAWGNRRWQDSTQHEDPLDMLALIAAEEVDYKVGGSKTGLWHHAPPPRRPPLLSQQQQPLGAAPGKRSRAELQESEDAGSEKRARLGGEEEGGEGGPPLLCASDPRAVQISVAEHYLQRLARENYEVFSAAVKNIVRSRKEAKRNADDSAHPEGKVGMRSVDECVSCGCSACVHRVSQAACSHAQQRGCCVRRVHQAACSQAQQRCSCWGPSGWVWACVPARPDTSCSQAG